MGEFIIIVLIFYHMGNRTQLIQDELRIKMRIVHFYTDLTEQVKSAI